MEKIYEVRGNKIIILHNGKEFEVVRSTNGEFKIKDCVFDNTQEFIFVINALTDFLEELTMSPEEKASILKEREKKRLKAEQKLKIQKPRTFSRSKMTEETKRKISEAKKGNKKT